MAKRVAVVGSANMDLIMRLPRLPQKGESVAGDSFSRAFGGKGANQAVAAARAGAEVTAVFNLGDDEFSRQMLAVYREEGLDTAWIRQTPGESAGVALILVDAAGDNSISVFPGANGKLTGARVAEAEKAIADSALVMLQMEVPGEANRRAIELARRHGAEVMLNFAPASHPDLELAAGSDILVVNETEAEALSGLPAASPEAGEAAAAALGKIGPRLVIVTFGDKGSLVWEKSGRVWRRPAFPVAAVDATAAGDSFCGAFAAARAEGRTLEDALGFASAAGALAASRPGALPSLPTRREIEEFQEKSR
ncbi:MAG: ribokinase [Planctomycetota bacterium]|jgi:ribokinase|nr:ribokinase [Planctomycetota bacterium]